ncbi:MAG: YidC/Oxa1 family membrane protein insertase [Clostridiales bacterium]|jgi:YidC/Oxa1 family membrane protein insertase|nr:YidC/Oxa1 family membrane protein insertase [Clostridiales bacterium]
MSIWSIIVWPFAFIINLIYQIVPNYGWSVIIFTIFVKLLLLPLAIKQQKSMIEMQLLNPQMQELQKRYPNDKEKVYAETQKLYQRYKINPLAGCLPLLIQLPIIFAIFSVVNKPLTYILNMDAAAIDALTQQITQAGITLAPGASQISMLSQAAHAGLSNIPYINLNFLGLDLSYTPAQMILPTWQINLYWIIPLLSGLTSFVSSRLSMAITQQRVDNAKSLKEKQAAKNVTIDANSNVIVGTDKGSADVDDVDDTVEGVVVEDKSVKENGKPTEPTQEEMMQQQQKTTMLMMPAMSLIMTFNFVSAIGLYWIVSNVTQLVQQYYLNKKYNYNTVTLENQDSEAKVISTNGKRGKAKKSTHGSHSSQKSKKSSHHKKGKKK